MGDRLGIQVAVDNLLHPGDHHLAAWLTLGGRTGQRRQSWHENHTRHFCSFSLISFLSGLSLALNKEGCDWQDRHSAWANSKASECQADLIHTSCRSESSNISLVVLDNDMEFWGGTQLKFCILVLLLAFCFVITNRSPSSEKSIQMFQIQPSKHEQIIELCSESLIFAIYQNLFLIFWSIELSL